MVKVGMPRILLAYPEHWVPLHLHYQWVYTPFHRVFITWSGTSEVSEHQTGP